MWGLTSTSLVKPLLYCNTTQPLYSPDLTHIDSHLFPKLKEHLARMHFSNNDKVKDEVQRFLNDMVARWYDKGTQTLPQHLQKCSDWNGNYVQKLMMMKLGNDGNIIYKKFFCDF